MVGTPKGPRISLDQERVEGLEKRIRDAANMIFGVSWVEGELNKPCPNVSREELTSSSVRAAQNEKLKIHKLRKVNSASLSQTQPKSPQIQPNSTDGWFLWRNHSNME